MKCFLHFCTVAVATKAFGHHVQMIHQLASGLEVTEGETLEDAIYNFYDVALIFNVKRSSIEGVTALISQDDAGLEAGAYSQVEKCLQALNGFASRLKPLVNSKVGREIMQSDAEINHKLRQTVTWTSDLTRMVKKLQEAVIDKSMDLNIWIYLLLETTATPDIDDLTTSFYLIED